MMMVSALMFDAGLSVIVQGSIPDDMGEDGSIPAFFGLVSLGLALHFLAIVSAIALQERMSSFMVERTVGQQETLKSLRVTLNKFLDHMKGSEKSEVHHGIDDEYKLRSKLADKLREQVLVRIRGSSTSCASFDSWFLIHCAQVWKYISWFFKIGTLSLLVSLALYARLKVMELHGGLNADEYDPAAWAFHGVLMLAMVIWAYIEYSQRRYSRITGKKRHYNFYEQPHDELSAARVGTRIVEIEKAIKQVTIARSLREAILTYTGEDLQRSDDLVSFLEADCQKQEADARRMANAVAQHVEDSLSRALRFTDGPRARLLMRTIGSLRSPQHVKYWLDRAEKLDLGDGKAADDPALADLRQLELFAKEVREQRFPVILERVRLHDAYQKARRRLLPERKQQEELEAQQAVSRMRVDEFHLMDTARTLFEELDVDGSKTITLLELLVAIGVEKAVPASNPRNRPPTSEESSLRLVAENADELFFRQQSVDRVHALLRANDDLAGALVSMFVSRVNRHMAKKVKKALQRIKTDPEGARAEAHLAVENFCKSLPTSMSGMRLDLDAPPNGAEVTYDDFLQHVRDTFM